MPQSLTRLPEAVHIRIGIWEIEIVNYKIKKGKSFLGFMMDIIASYNWKEFVDEMQKHGISYESVIETCAEEIEHNNGVFANIAAFHYKALKTHDDSKIFSKSVAGRRIADEIIERMRQCENWQELYSIMIKESETSKDIRNKIVKEWDMQCKK